MKPIGGYFGLQVGDGLLPHPKAFPVNFGRGGLEVILRVREYKRVWIPDYICPCVPRFLNRLGITYETYPINERLELPELPRLRKGDGFLYVNYFGVKNDYCRKLEKSIGHNGLILDLTQAFHYVPRRADAFNSARKFFPVPDGGFVYLHDGVEKHKMLSELPPSHSFDSCEALLRRADGDLAGGYEAFHKSEALLENASAAKMSELTRGLLSAQDIRGAYKQRISNYLRLSFELRDANLLKFKIDDTTAPLVYPFLPDPQKIPDAATLRERLISAKIFCPTYWLDIAQLGPAAKTFVENLVCIPLDQRYGADDMNRLLEMINDGH